MTSKNEEELRQAGKQLAILVDPDEDVKKLVELHLANGHNKQLSKFQFVECKRDFAANLTHKTLVEGMQVIFFTDKNKLKLRVMNKVIAND